MYGYNNQSIQITSLKTVATDLFLKKGLVKFGERNKKDSIIFILAHSHLKRIGVTAAWKVSEN